MDPSFFKKMFKIYQAFVIVSSPLSLRYEKTHLAGVVMFLDIYPRKKFP
jgi:hypothetical protein